MIIVRRHPSRFKKYPSQAIVKISAICPMLMAGWIQFSGRPSLGRNELVQTK